MGPAHVESLLGHCLRHAYPCWYCGRSGESRPPSCVEQGLSPEGLTEGDLRRHELNAEA